MNALQRWWTDRIPVTGDQIRELTNEPVPNHLKRWWFCLGGTAAYLFFVQLFTGILLAFYYQASPADAWDSVAYITDEVAYGWYIRSVHKWGAILMIAAVVLHQMRVYFTGAYRKPREMSWVVGMLLLFLTVICGFTGYSLVYEQLSYWGATVGANIADNVPLVGGVMKKMLLAGDSYNSHTLSRFFILHGAALPMAILAVFALHIVLIRIQGVTELEGEEEKRQERKTFNFLPDHLYTEIIIGTTLVILLTVLATVLPAEMGHRADPLTTPEVIKPEWYFYVVFRWLKLFPERVAIMSTGAIVFLMFAWPWIDGAIRRRRPGSEASVFIGILAVLAIVGLTVWEALVAH
ncbi:MAG: cytochrome bc complex cytochrome b subunit [Planctomycetales bacterium]|nr:cytochrome bc complex cytochrome b subunit [bacterium]UNM08434.1 MAG: cytochrome bc complex cytochrome b subunit [Planctomycetales bacterium]